MLRTPSSSWIPVLLLFLPAAASAEPPTVGHVATLHGKVVAERPGEEPRVLSCRDPIYRGDKVVTTDGSRVGLLLGDLLAHVGKRSKLQVADAADYQLEQGAVRVIDPREAGARARLGVVDTDAQILGNDLEGYVFAEKTGGYAMLCEWDAPLPVARGPESKTARPGECVIAKRKEPMYVADAHDERLGSPNEDLCSLGPVIGDLDLHLSPTDVAAGPPLGPWSGLPSPLTLPTRSPCDVPGSPCVGIIETPPGGGGVPGGGGPFPGIP